MMQFGGCGAGRAGSGWTLRGLAAAGALLLLSSCAAMPGGGGVAQQQAMACGGPGAGLNKTDIGAGIGAAAGGLLGGLVAGPHNRVVGVLAGAGLGGVLGGTVGAQLDAQDCARLTEQMQASLQTSRDGQAEHWASGNGAYHATIVPSRTHYETRTVAIKRAAGVEPSPDLVVTSRTGVAARTTDILSAPRTGASTLGSIAAGDAVRVVGHPRSASSYDMIAQQGVAVGYIKASALSRSQHVASADTAALTTVAPLRSATDLDSASGDADVDHVSARVECRSVTTTLTGSDGTSKNSSASACQTPDGAWNLGDYGAAG